jgi:hypothetical protein
LLTHALPGSTALSSLSELKSRNGRDTLAQERLSGPNQTYLAVDSLTFPSHLVNVFPGAYGRVRDAGRNRLEAYAFAESGDWGRMESVVTYDRASGRTRVQQHVVRAPVRP